MPTPDRQPPDPVRPFAMVIPRAEGSITVPLEAVCAHCHGARVIGSELWAEFWRSRRVRFEKEPTTAEDRAAVERWERDWWNGQPGIRWSSSAASPVYTAAGAYVPEEDPCPACDGAGYVVTPAGRAILAFVWQYQGAR